MWSILLTLSCQMFYYSDDKVAQVEVTKVVNSWNVGIHRSYASSLKVLIMTEDGILGHGSANLFHYYDQFFVVTAAHVVDANLEYLNLIVILIQHPLINLEQLFHLHPKL